MQNEECKVKRQKAKSQKSKVKTGLHVHGFIAAFIMHYSTEQQPENLLDVI
ncbi:hypothetical protein [Segetibacter sp. 3557_3]|uniref:hypothetical protein n=1 Tax=Segetibacter sp. 3557_3 TaxID=2547429 RepID=UPI001404937F|nr:hypothetical protein [Segetibacter sp. 3557_3]